MSHMKPIYVITIIIYRCFESSVVNVDIYYVINLGSKTFFAIDYNYCLNFKVFFTLIKVQNIFRIRM